MDTLAMDGVAIFITAGPDSAAYAACPPRDIFHLEAAFRPVHLPLLEHSMVMGN